MPRQKSPLDLDPGVGLTEHIIVLPDGRRLRTVVAGEGPGPLVVFEAGMSAPAACWVHTQREVSARARTLSYDRAGYGGSDIDPHDRTLDRIVNDLTAMLDALGEAEPVVLVGHSWGGPIIRLFADRHPHRVAGLVFVDSSLAEAMSRMSAIVGAWSFRVMAMLVWLGMTGLIEKMSLPTGFAPEISEADRTVLRRDYACMRAMRAGSREAAQIASALPTLRRLQDTGTPDVPTVCLQGGRVDRGMARVRPLLNETATRLMADAPKGRVVIVEQAGHLIPQECPTVVRDTILEVVTAVDEGRHRT
ncbi:alpha/beta fold hydrolase [Lentzea flava]|uniref:Hydrolase or acyltransferase of alpha/beta superfamily protein n=1 Tax=Lentzea flava TaxID=103732 RepID=A0ABQ2VJK0_9PSEU|nr:alpha/beta hydrolase [Lentzea flava]MCP2205320.1 Pimeloyl-ACP methyl ester carboxylesterase [Lentzea flava]GGU85376.1 hydrolase or acyltransferase of alpha/beta superfamily protein [Lentzea flava]